MNLENELVNYLNNSKDLGVKYERIEGDLFFNIYLKTNPVPKHIIMISGNEAFTGYKDCEVRLKKLAHIICFLEIAFEIELPAPTTLSAQTEKTTIINVDSLELKNGSVLFDVAITYSIDRSDRQNVIVDILSVVWMHYDITKICGETEKFQLSHHLPNYPINL
jgi:hypothetical protein